MGVDHTSWTGALTLASIQVGLLFFLARLLQKKPSAGSMTLIGAGLILTPGLTQTGTVTVGKALAVFLTYALFVGFGEEILYRGYMQSRLNEVFGKPYNLYGVTFGWGAIITALFFGLTHVGLLRWMLGSTSELTWAWGFWTTFGGLVFGFIREKSGSVFPPALLHGLPQAIASVLMLYL
jgi:membrane protease YdiL (CAAX protease family)